MIYPDVSVEEWCNRYPGLKPSVSSCVVCKRKRIANIPFLERDWSGFIADRCECGLSGESFSTQYPLTNKSKDLIYSFLTSEATSDTVLNAIGNKPSMEKPVPNRRLKIIK